MIELVPQSSSILLIHVSYCECYDVSLTSISALIEKKIMTSVAGTVV